ncbi:MAG: type II toxin-antitoxin system RelE/ParE family toxin [Verrucomicrobiae bacterium]|nr:type II toxin-antitoxin system RelE/ParE family toxin [Verrucomicrobiae bacterium]
MKHWLHPEADEEFAAAVRYYAAISPELGVRFYREMERLFREICEHPERFHRFDPPARRHFSRSFPYAVVFIEKPGCIWIVAVMHMKRRPGYWRARLV